MKPDLDHQLGIEWLITNARGGYASGTSVGIPTRRYHGLLIASARPPLERWLMLSAVLERVSAGPVAFECPGLEFAEVVHPHGFEHQTGFAVSNNRLSPWVRFTYEQAGVRLIKQIILVRGRDEAVIRYRVEAPPDASISLSLCPLTAMRDFHGLTRCFSPGFAVDEVAGYVTVDASYEGPRLWLRAESTTRGGSVAFERRPDWWYELVYRGESARGQDDREDLFTPGWFHISGPGPLEATFHAAADFGMKTHLVPTPPGTLLPHLRGEPATDVEERLREATDPFICKRLRAGGELTTTIVAGYHWFGDWGRDAMIALPGLLLETERFSEAREVLETFASAQQDGLIPNRFSDYGDGCDYNSVDASLWFIHAADAYCTASGDEKAWPRLLGPVCERIVEAFTRGTRFNIHTDEDGLVSCGDEYTQLTWMDAKFGPIVFTPRHGKPVEINALWYHALCVLARRSVDAKKVKLFKATAEKVRDSFGPAFWNQELGCLYDVIRPNECDDAVRPNQILAVSLPDSPLNPTQQQSVVSIVARELLTPYGLRSLAPGSRAYRPHYVGGPFERDSSYHQGTVWGWLIGPYVEAYLRINGFSADARNRMRELLQPLVRHLDESCINSVNEIFDAEPPHTPRGCVAQAWSVAELYRAWRMVCPRT